MDIHKNARLTPFGRERMANMVLGGQTPKAVSEAIGVCSRTVRKTENAYGMSVRSVLCSAYHTHLSSNARPGKRRRLPFLRSFSTGVFRQNR
jgi:hypothetical protein